MSSRNHTAAIEGLTIRQSVPDDEAALRYLATLEERAVPCGPMLLAEVGGELWAAAPLHGGVALGDPFRPTADIIALLEHRARQLERATGWRRRARAGVLRRLRPHGV